MSFEQTRPHSSRKDVYKQGSGDGARQTEHSVEAREEHREDVSQTRDEHRLKEVVPLCGHPLE